MYNKEQCFGKVTVFMVILGMLLIIYHGYTSSIDLKQFSVIVRKYSSILSKTSNTSLTEADSASTDCLRMHKSETKLPLTYLASFPGSGNTWVRHLLQQASGKI